MSDSSTDGSDHQPWEKARDEVLDEMADLWEYDWTEVEIAVDKMVRRWRDHDTDTEQ